MSLRPLNILSRGLVSYNNVYSMTGYAKCGPIPALAFGKASTFSVSYWTKVIVNNTSINAGSIIGNMDNGSTGFGWDMFNTAGLNGDLARGFQPRMSFNNNGTTSRVGVEPTTINSDGGWHHTVATYNGNNSGTPTNDILIYIDTTLQTCQSVHDASIASGDFNGTNSFNLCTRNSGGGVARSFNGRFDMPSVYNTVLSQTQINQLYNGRSPVDVSRLSFYSSCVANWPIGEGSDSTSTIIDLKNGYNATGTGVVFSSDVVS